MVQIYCSADAWLVCAMSRTTVGVWIAGGPPQRLAGTASAEELGSAVLEAAERSLVGVPHPQLSEWNAISRLLLDAAGIKTWRTFAQEAGCVEVASEEGQLVVSPQRRQNDDRQVWFEPSDGGSILVNAKPAQVGTAVIAVMRSALADSS